MYPPLPTARSDNLYSFYAYSVSARERAHASLNGGASGPSTAAARRPLGASVQTAQTGLSRIGTSLAPLDSRRTAARRSAERVAHRALNRQRTAGAALAHDAQDLSDEEEALEKRKHETNAFGYRFLMPIGRAMTQMEMEAAPSPTPSDGEHVQEDRNGGATPIGSPEPEPEDDIDLDASIEDRDQDARSTEYDSDDLRLMRDMDRSIGSRTPGSDDDMDEEE